MLLTVITLPLITTHNRDDKFQNCIVPRCAVSSKTKKYTTDPIWRNITVNLKIRNKSTALQRLSSLSYARWSDVYRDTPATCWEQWQLQRLALTTTLISRFLYNYNCKIRVHFRSFQTVRTSPAVRGMFPVEEVRTEHRIKKTALNVPANKAFLSTRASSLVNVCWQLAHARIHFTLCWACQTRCPHSCPCGPPTFQCLQSYTAFFTAE